MTEPFQPLEIPLIGGVDQSKDPRHVPNGKLLSGNNIRRAKDGAYSKRLGFTKVPTAADTSGASVALTRVFARGSELIGTTYGGGSGSYLYSYASTATAPNSLSYRSIMPAMTADTHGINDFGSAYSYDIACCPNTRTMCIVATGLSGGAYGIVTDENLTATINGPYVFTPSADGERTRVVAVGNTYVVAYYASGNIHGAYFNSANSAAVWTSGVDVLMNCTSDSPYRRNFDICAGAGGDRFYLVGQRSGLTPVLAAASYYPNLVSINNVIPNAPAGWGNVSATSIYSQSSTGDSAVTICAAYQNTTSGNTELWSGAYYANLTEMAFNQVITTPANDTRLWYLSHYTEGDTTYAAFTYTANLDVGVNATTTKFVTFDANAGTVSYSQDGYNIAGRGKLRAIRGYSMFHGVTYRAAGGNIDRTPSEILFACPESNTEGFLPMCTVFPRYGGIIAAEAESCSFTRDSQGKYTTVAMFNRSGVTRLGASVVKYSDSPSDIQFADFNGLVCMTGGVPGFYDGSKFKEFSFVMSPNVIAASNTAISGGALTPASTYRYGVIYTQWDREGNIHRSPPEFRNVTIGASGNAAALKLSSLNSTYRQEFVYGRSFNYVGYEIYRSLANTADPLYLVNTEAVTVTSGVKVAMADSQLGYTDTASDTAISSRQTLYTSSGLLPDVNPPSSRLLCVHRGRLWLAGTPDGKQVWASKKALSQEGPAFSDAFVFSVDARVTALASMDDKLLVFSADGVWFITGDGPADNGANNDWSEPVRVQSSVGSVTPYVVTTPSGVIFQSRAGISIIDRGLNVNPYFGQPVDDYMTGKTISGAIVAPGTTEVRMPLVGGGEVRYDFRVNEWFTANSSVVTNVASAVVWQNTYTVLNYGTNVYTESASNCTDDGTFVPYTIELAPIKPAGTIGYMDIRKISVLTDKSSSASPAIILSVAIDGGSYSQGMTKVLGSNTGEMVFEYTPSSGKCRSAKIKIVDSGDGALGANVGDGVGANIVSVTVETAVKQGNYPIVPSARKG